MPGDGPIYDPAMRRSPTIAIWGHYHGGNLGDELVVATIIAAIRRRLPGARVVAISMAPADTLERHSIETYPINVGKKPMKAGTSNLRRQAPNARLPATGRTASVARRLCTRTAQIRKLVREVPFLWRSYRMLREMDLIVVAGSGQLLDEWRGPWLHPYTTFRWAMLARLARVPILYPSVGAGPITSRLSAFFIRKAVASAEYLSVRDAHSGRVLASIGVAGPLSVCPDMGYGIPGEMLRAAQSASAERMQATVVGLNVMAHQDPRYWPRGDVRRYDSFLRKMSAFASWLLDNGYAVRLFSSQTRSDARVAADLVRLLEETGPLDPSRFDSAIGEVEQVDDLIRVIAGCDLVVAARYHSVLLPLLLDIPVLGLAYNAKTSELLSDAGHPERSLDIDDFSVAALIEAFRDLRNQDGTKERAALRARIAGHRTAVEKQFDTLFGPVEADRRQF
jgi:polysaccharide pyruvyl transferase WcaK-like protein